MLDTFLSLIAPHHCSGCGFEGTLLCENCKYDITSEPYLLCGACGKGLPGKSGICTSCIVPYQRLWCIADRRDSLQWLIGSYKFMNARDAYRPLAELLDEGLPELPANVRIVPIPTVNSHIRQRGYDHMQLVARRLASLRKQPLDTSLVRLTSTKQRDAGAKQRIAQAKVAFGVDRHLDPDSIYLLLDDVITTGATVRYASQVLLNAGATKVWVASISRQPLD